MSEAPEEGSVVLSAVGNSLRSARERAGWSRETLAHHSGLSGAAIAQIETGRRQDIRLASLVALAGALGVSVDYLVGGTATVAPPQLCEHRILMYDSDAAYLASTVPFLREGIARDHCLLAVTTRHQADLFRDALGADARHVEFRDAADWYRSPVAALGNYRSFVQDRFASGARWIRIVGEPVWAGLSKAEATEWLRYESLVNMAFASSPASLICPYDTRSASEEILADARHTHPLIADGDGVSTSVDYREPEDFLLSLR
jgi:transcriptional regulator with XRE-family HTH domain